MTEKITLIPTRVKNASTNGYVAGAEDIIDENLNKNQESINLENKNKINAHDADLAPGGNVDIKINSTKTSILGNVSEDYNTLSKIESRIKEEKAIRANEINAEVERATNAESIEHSRAVEAENQLLALYNSLTQSDKIVGPLPDTGVSDIIYRVPGESSYTDYMWYNNGWHKMAEYNNAMDEEPIDGSNNIIKSGGLAKLIKRINSGDNDISFGIVDKYENIILSIEGNQLKHYIENVFKKIGIENDKSDITTEIFNYTSNYFTLAVVDKYYNVIFGIGSDGIINSIKQEKELVDDKPSITYENNKEEDLILIANSNYGTTNKRFQALVLTDSHINTESFKNAINCCKDFNSLDCLIHLGDYCYNTRTALYNVSTDLIKESIIPSYYSIGNHDIGIGNKNVSYTMFNDELYDIFVKPLIDKKWINPGEYQEGKLYYYHDFNDTNTRIIVLFPFDDDCALDETYWEQIPYDSSYSLASAGSFVVGDCINMPYYKKGSFRCVQDVTISASPSYGSNQAENLKWPCVKCVRPNVWFSQEQLEWLCQTLDDAGEKNLDVVICSHLNIVSKKYVDIDSITEETVEGYYTDNDSFPSYLDRYETVKDSELISDIITAYKSESNKHISINIQAKAGNNSGSGLTPKVYDDCSHLTVNLNYTFNNSGNAVIICGHNHKDGIIRHVNNKVLEIGLAADVIEYASYKPIRSENKYSKGYDLFTAITMNPASQRLFLTRIGGNIVPSLISEDSGEYVKFKNKIITF